MSEKSNLTNVFLSGFGGYKDFFPLISENCRFLVPFVNKLEDIFSCMDCGGDTLMGWSTGAHIIGKNLHSITDKWQKIVLVAPFDDFTNCFGSRVIDAMIKGLDRDFYNTMSLFYKKCGIRTEFKTHIEHIDEFKECLNFLKSSTIEKSSLAENITVIHGCNDQISKRTGVLKILHLFKNSKFMEVDQPHFISEDILMRFF